MNDEIKSAREIAMEKIAALGTATNNDKLKWKFIPEGEKIALKYLREGTDIEASISTYSSDAQQYIKNGAEEVLLTSIQLPVNDKVESGNKKAMDGIISIKKDKNAAKKLLEQMKQILEHYSGHGAEQRLRTYDGLKQQYEARLKQAVSQQLGTNTDADLGISVETLPQFQEEWRRTAAQMDDQYFKLIDEYKNELRKIK
jgi:hypothetical protein